MRRLFDGRSVVPCAPLFGEEESSCQGRVFGSSRIVTCSGCQAKPRVILKTYTNVRGVMIYGVKLAISILLLEVS